MKKINCHIISNTHWDREWRYPFQSYRMDLADMMDRLLDILEKSEDYRAFFLDSQTVILEDYFEVRPENKKRVRKLIKADRIQIGPWYTLPDEWACHGESLIRNLLIGHSVGRKYGPVSKIGYTPFSNGQISQLPQIYNGFGIDSCFFYRGIGKHVSKSEFLWESPDGSRVFGFRFGDYARYNYYYLIYRPGLLGRFSNNRDYNWNADEIPYHTASEQSQDRQYGWIKQEMKVHDANLKQALDECRKFTTEDATTSQLLYMMGHDHSFAAAEETDLIKGLQKYINHEEEDVFHSSLSDYLKAFRKEEKVLDVFYGEMRHTNKIGLWTNLMAMILSCRTYVKQENFRVNQKIIHTSEPLSVMAWLTGSKYPEAFLDIAWKKILINQAHDAVGGCSVDRVHREMFARWEEVDTIGDELSRRSMRDVVSRIDGSQIPSDNLQLTVFNSLPYERRDVSDFIIDIPAVLGSQGFVVETLSGEKIEAQILSVEDYTPTIEGGYEVSMPFSVKRFRTKILLDGIPPLGYKAYKIKPVAFSSDTGEAIAKSSRKLENEFLSVSINDNGTIDLFDKRTGNKSSGIGLFEDTAEFGDPWNRVVPLNDAPIYSKDAKAQTSVVFNGALFGCIKVAFDFETPAEKKDKENRSEKKTIIPIELLVSLSKNSESLEIAATLDNTAKDHRLRILSPTNIRKATHVFAEGQFDVLKRPIKLPDATGFKEPPYPTNPMWTFTDVSDGEAGFTIINDGLIEYEAIDDEERTIAITLLRCFGKFVYERPTPEAQCPGMHRYRFLLCPHKGDWNEGGAFKKSALHNTKPAAILSAPSKGALPPELGFFKIAPGNIALSGIKKSEDSRYLILRFWNPTDKDETVTIETPRKIKKAVLMNMEEKIIQKIKAEPNCVKLDAPPKKIITLGILA